MVAKDYGQVNFDLFLRKMAERFTVSDVLDLLENDKFSLSYSHEGEFEGDNIEGYLPRAELEVSLGKSTSPMEEDDDEQMDFEYIVSNDSSVSSEESDTQPLGKSDSKYNSVESKIVGHHSLVEVPRDEIQHLKGHNSK